MRQLQVSRSIPLHPKFVSEGYVYINPSVCDDHVYYRCLKIQSGIWYNKSLLYCKSKDEYMLMDCDVISENCSISQGIEDLRLFDFAGDAWFIGCMRGKNNTFKTLIGKLEINALVLKHTMDDPLYNIKNIVPLIFNDKLHLLDIFRKSVYNYEKCTGFNVCGDLQLDQTLSGSSQFLQLSDYIFGGIVHSVSYKKLYYKTRYIINCIYQHYWMEIDIRDFKVTLLSSPFFLHHVGVEFVSGIEKINNDEFCLYYGVDDNRSYKCTVNLDELRKI